MSARNEWNLWANTVEAHGNDELKQRFLGSLQTDKVAMCLLYSEPGAGSDLASLATTAQRDGDEWVVTGQKVWTSGGRQADYAFLIARTDWDQPKHRGITFFFFPMRQPGVEVRPLRQATGDSRFNEVFITEARVPHSHVLGDVNAGWTVLQTALMYERAVMGVPIGRRRPPQTAAEPDPTSEATAPTPDLSLLDLARRLGRTQDPLVRQDLARLHAMRCVIEWNARRAAAELARNQSSSLASLGKLSMSGVLHFAGRLQVQLLGAEGSLAAASSAEAGDAAYSMINAYFYSIGGGTDQIQRNILGERVLGLPKEPEVDKGVPFRNVRRS
jgi:alkylation response protein AidB-like acyl-CoA dehydrogenase